MTGRVFLGILPGVRSGVWTNGGRGVNKNLGYGHEVNTGQSGVEEVQLRPRSKHLRSTFNRRIESV